MATVVRMPSVMANQEQGAVASWLTAEGRSVRSGEPLAEIETEKAVVEFAAEVDGVIGRLLIEPGAMVPVGTPIAVLLDAGDGAGEITVALQAAGVAVEARSDDAAATATPPGPGASATKTIPRSAQSTTPAESSSPTAIAAAALNGGRLIASPIVRHLARSHDVDLREVAGTGPGGRVVRRDLEAWLRDQPTTDAPAPGGPVGATVSDSRIGAATVTAPSSAQVPAVGSWTDLPVSGMRRAIARRLTESTVTVPHFYLRADCRVDRLLTLRTELNDGVDRSERLSINDLVVKAVAGALVEIPQANTVWTGDHLRRFDGVDIAVAVDVPNGLLTPVVRDVHRMSIGTLGGSIRELAERARRGELRQDELEGGSFAVSNLGMRGITEFAAIINPPQAGILAVGAATRRPVVQDDGTITVGTVMTVTLSADHRVLDGALAADWLTAFQRRIENPLQLLR